VPGIGESSVEGFYDGPSPRIAKQRFEREACSIIRRWKRRCSDASEGRQQENSEDPACWMLRHTYGLIRSLIAADQVRILGQLVQDLVPPRGLTDIHGKPFKQALLVMAWWAGDSSKRGPLSRRRRSEISDAMEYAARHEVAPRQFNAFIKMAGIKRIPMKLRDGQWEPGYEPA
jgi:hypothetical protein